MRDFSAPLSSVEIYQGCRTPSEGSEFSESSSEPSLSASSSSREIYEGLRTPDCWLPLSQISVDIEGIPDEKSEGIPTHCFSRPVAPTFTFGKRIAAANDFADDLIKQLLFVLYALRSSVLRDLP